MNNHVFSIIIYGIAALSLVGAATVITKNDIAYNKNCKHAEYAPPPKYAPLKVFATGLIKIK